MSGRSITALMASLGFLAVMFAPEFNGGAQAAYEPPDHHAEMEFLARKFGYEGGRAQKGEDPEKGGRETTEYLILKGDSVFRDHLKKRGYKLRDAIDDRDSGMQAMVLEDAKGKIFIVFRGTEEEVGDAATDLDKKGDIGKKQFEKNKKKLKAWSEKFPDATVTGHSLGSALGQRYIAEYPDKVREGVFFNPPGIDKRHANKLANIKVPPPVTLYVARGKDSVPDLVSELGGQSHIPGRVVEAEITGDSIYSHSSWMIDRDGVSLTEIDYQDYQDRRVENYEKIRHDLSRKGGYIDTGLDLVGDLVANYFGLPKGYVPEFVKDEVRFYVDNELMTGPVTPTEKMVAAGKKAGQIKPDDGKDKKPVKPEEKQTASLPDKPEIKARPARLTPEATAIVTTRDSYGGPALGAGETVVNGDVLAFKAQIAHLGGPGESVLAGLSWQLFAPDGAPVDGISKARQIASEGGQEEARFRVHLDGLANGQYTVALTHQNLSAPDKIAQSVTTFKIYQSVRLSHLVVDSTPEGKTHRGVLYNDEAPHLFAYYEMGEGIDAVTVTFRVLDKKSGAEIYAKSIERQRKNGSVLQRVGLRLAPGLVKVDRPASFDVTLAGPDGKQETASRDFKISDYKLSLNVPSTLDASSGKPFSIGVPKVFQPPYRVDINPRSGLMIHYRPGQLKGTISGVTEDTIITPGLDVTVIDSQGRRASAHASITVKPLPKPKPKPKVLPPSVASSGSSAKDRCPIPKRYTDPSKNGETYAVRNVRRKGEIYSASLHPITNRGWWGYQNVDRLKITGKFSASCNFILHGPYTEYGKHGMRVEGTFVNGREHGRTKIFKDGRFSHYTYWNNGAEVKK